MIKTLPEDLKQAEAAFTEIIINNINNIEKKKLILNLKFEGLRINPIALRLCSTLNDNNIETVLIWSDAGSVALAKRDRPDLIENIHSYSDIITKKYIAKETTILIAVSPQPYDYELFESVCDIHKGKIIMINGKLEDTAVGIGSIGRDRRKQFISGWDYLYSIEPNNQVVLLKAYPFDWSLFRSDPDGYRHVAFFKQKPDSEIIAEALFN